MYEDVTRETYDKSGREFSEKTYFPVFRELIQNAVDYFLLTVPPGGTILIIGAGDGRDGQIFLQKGYKVVLLDYSKTMLDIAKEKCPVSEIQLCDFREMKFNESSFDGVWASTCLYHVRKSFMPKIFRDIYAFLKPQGVFYFNLKQGKGEEILEKPASLPEGGPRFYSFYFVDEIISLIKDFSILKIKAYDEKIKEHYIQVWLKK